LPWQDNAPLSTPVSILVTVAGVLLILTALRDVFDTLFHPGGRAAASRTIMRIVWRVYHPIARLRPTAISLAGPTALILIVAFWAMLLIVGWALIFWPHVPDEFSFQPGTEHGGLGGFVDAIYLSIVTLATVGYGDVTPDAGWLRVVTPVEALLGFGLLTASISWLGSIYPAVQRRRALAYEIYLLREAQSETGIDVLELDPASASAVYGDLISRVVAVERDLVTFPISYYFAQNDDRFALSAAMPYVWDLAQRGADAGTDERARLRAVMLRDAIRDFATTVAHRFHGARAEDDTEELLAAYARDHMRDPERGQPSGVPR
jgi:Ion channel